ncbi:MAG: hypothetical protein KDC49_03035 [Saprospiraceae bacterium]|nr:hypothetical protein [Saprospiraceae bacterium]
MRRKSLKRIQATCGSFCELKTQKNFASLREMKDLPAEIAEDFEIYFPLIFADTPADFRRFFRKVMLRPLSTFCELKTQKNFAALREMKDLPAETAESCAENG